MKINFTQVIALLESNPTLATKLLSPAAILGVLKVYNDFTAIKSSGTLTVADEFRIADEVLAVLEAAGVTVADVRSLVTAAKSLFVK
jgi:hypothetical protein